MLTKSDNSPEFSISFCIICKERLSQLAQTLAINIADNAGYKNLEFLILDYNSQDDMEYWVKNNFQHLIKSGRLLYYKTNTPTRFQHSHAKNLAFKLASGEIVCNINADHFTGPHFAHYINKTFQQKENIVLTPIRKNFRDGISNPPKDVLGKVCVKKTDFLKVCGFDERMITYGFEDYDFINRLEMLHVNRHIIYRKSYLKFISHDDDMRYPIDEIYKNLERIIIRHITPFSSSIILLFSDGSFELAEIINNQFAGHNNYKNSFGNRRTNFKFSIKGFNWNRGKAIRVADLYHLHTETDDNANLTLLRNGDLFLLNKSTKEQYFTLLDINLKNALLDFHYLYKNREILERNLADLVVQPNKNSFGRGIVFRNFNYQKPLIVD